MNERPKDAIAQASTDKSAVRLADKSVRAALIASENILSDYSTFLEHLLVGLADEAVPAVLVCPPQCEIDPVPSGSAEIVRHPAINLPFLAHQNRKWLAEQLSKFKPTVLHCLCESKAGLTKQLACQLNLPYLLTINSLRRPGTHLSISAKHCARIIVPAESIADDVARTYPRLAGRIEQINIGTFVEERIRCFSLSPRLWVPAERGPSAGVRRPLAGANKDSRLASMVIAYPLDSVADFENLFNAARHLAIGGYEFALVVMGAGRAESQLRKLLAALDLLQMVTIVPRLKPWRSVLSAGDIFIQPRPNWAFNPLLLEAMSLGLAIAACKGGVDDLIIEDRTATVFDPADELSIRGSLQQLFDKPEFARKLAEGAQNYVRANHSVSSMVSATLQAYHQAQQWFGQLANRKS